MYISSEDIKEMARKILEKFCYYDIDISHPKERMEKILKKSEQRRQIIFYMPVKNHKLYGDFVVVAMKDKKRDIVGVKVGKSKEEIERYQNRQEELRRKLEELGKRKFIERIFILADHQTDEELTKDWEKAIKQFKES